MQQTQRKVKLGFIARFDTGGLGCESQEVLRWLKPDKVLAIQIGELKHFPERLKGHNFAIAQGIPTDNQIRDFLKGVDVLFTIETAYNQNTWKIAREMGVKTILRINYEWFDRKDNPDLILAPSLWYFDLMPENKKYQVFPVNTEIIKPIDLSADKIKPKTFLHIAGNCKAAYDRNGTQLILKAIPLVKNQNIKFIIRSQVPIDIKDKRVEIIIADVDDYSEIWKDDAQVFLYPRRYGGQSLSLNEAMARGLAILSSKVEPQKDFLHNELLLDPTKNGIITIKQQLEIFDFTPESLAKKIDEVASLDNVKKYCQHSLKVSDEWSWKKQVENYNKIFEKIC